MADKAASKLVVLWENEIRIAARLLHEAVELSSKEGRTEPEETYLSNLVFDALNASIAALAGAEDDEATLVLSSHQALRIGKKPKKAT